MTNRMLCLTALLLVLSVACAHAGTFELTIPVTGFYGSDRNLDIDFGRQFTSISGMSIVWSGTVTPGWYSDPVEGVNGPWGGGFYAGLLGPNGRTAWWANTPSLGQATYPQAESFSRTDAFRPFNQYDPVPWDFLLDGKAGMYIEFSRQLHVGGGMGGPPPTGNLASAKLTLDATVPEPQTVTCLASGLLALAFGLRRKMRQ